MSLHIGDLFDYIWHKCIVNIDNNNSSGSSFRWWKESLREFHLTFHVVWVKKLNDILKNKSDTN